MLTAVLAVGDLPQPAPEDAQPLSTPPQVRDLAEALDETEALLAAGARVVLAVHATWDQPATETVRTLRGLVGRGTVVLVPSPLPPLAVFAVAAQLSALREHLALPGQLVAAADPVAARMVVIARMASVAKLGHPAPTVAQHARSWLPGTGFLVQVAPQESVMPMDGDGAAIAAFADLPMAAATILHAAGEGAHEEFWATDAVVPALKPRRAVGLSAAGQRAYYGTAKVIEVVGYPDELDLAAIDLHACRWCEEPVASSPCPFCGCRSAAEVSA